MGENAHGSKSIEHCICDKAYSVINASDHEDSILFLKWSPYGSENL